MSGTGVPPVWLAGGTPALHFFVDFFISDKVKRAIRISNEGIFFVKKEKDEH